MSIAFHIKRQRIAWMLILITSGNVITPTISYALTSGPSQPEIQAFQPAGTSEMVNLFTGDFSYNIPLFELPGPNGGYPFNISYEAGITMEQEASWVGLGWSLNPGAINRQMRGLPDDFNGLANYDTVKTTIAIDPSITVGVGGGVSGELFGASGEIASVGLSIFNNNYKGFGYSIDASAGFSSAASSGKTLGVNIGAGITLNSQEGANVNASLSLGSKTEQVGINAGFNSLQGLQDLSFIHSKRLSAKGFATAETDPKKGAISKNWEVSSSSSASLSVAAPSYTPQISMPLQNTSISARFNAGAAWWGLYGKGYLKGFYSEQSLKDNGVQRNVGGFGYLNYQSGAADAESVLDFNREKDGIVSKETPNLAIPSMTYDIYSVTGQGIGALYRPMRNDIGILRDPEVISQSTGAGLGIDGSGTLSHVGINLSINHSKSTSGGWTDANDAQEYAQFLSSSHENNFEPWNFKVHGEFTSEKKANIEKLGGNDAVRLRLVESNKETSASVYVEKNNNKITSRLSDLDLIDRSRKKRNEVIQTFTNKEILKDNNVEILPYFRDSYFAESGAESFTKHSYDRSTNNPDHIAGFTATTAGGIRYNYTIPVYNLAQDEVTFSTESSGANSKVDVSHAEDYDELVSGTDDTERMFRNVALSKYAHAYLLTSVLGSDYIDVKGDGVTSDDLGYWIKFNYKKATADTTYQWREPFTDANFVEGWRTNHRDNKGSFVYGKKEVWYLYSAESKSHIAKFHSKRRSDARGAFDKLQSANVTEHDVVLGGYSYRLDSIQLFSRSYLEEFPDKNYPIKTTRFSYSNKLCPGVPNASSGGKLTLTEIQFENGNGKRGKLNPYRFTYDHNYPYKANAYDRWGTYKPYSSSPQENIDFPYTDQAPAVKDSLDHHAAAWSLTRIQTPSGGKIIVDYESDDYAYVQHKQAMQMNPIIPSTGSASQSTFDLNPDGMVRFKLQKEVAGTFTDNGPEMRAEVKKYLDLARMQLYFKAFMKMPSNEYEYISGYAAIDTIKALRLVKDGGTKYVYGAFYLKLESFKVAGTDAFVHPITMRTWQHIRSNQPELARGDWKVKKSEDGNANAIVGQIQSLAKMFDQVKMMLGGFETYCLTNEWGKEIDRAKSWIRLNSIDKVKYGGGLRVKQITLDNTWDGDKEAVYGQVYDYKIIENGTDTISSGVATYEPMAGGEENSLRYAKKYVESRWLRSDNNLFFEFPINESYYPGPQVGYSQVTVTSLAAAVLENQEHRVIEHITLMDDDDIEKNVFPSGDDVTYGTTGKTVHEFYTAKEFPVRTDETDKIDEPSRLSIPIPFLGNLSNSTFASTQGYSITINDMHGKSKKVSTFRQKPEGGWEAHPISWVQYNYATEDLVYDNEKVFGVSNTFVENNDEDKTLSLYDAVKKDYPSNIEMYIMGQENEFFLDMRQSEDNTWEGGAYANLDIVYLPIFAPIPIPTIWPSIGKSKAQLRTSVANKIIYKSGILESVHAYDGGSLVKTKNRKWDKLTGQVVLQTVTNNFDQLVYNYTIPAHTQYAGLGGAYQNAGSKISIASFHKNGTRPGEFLFSSSGNSAALYPGDELVIYEEGEPIATAIFLGDSDGSKLVSSFADLEEIQYTATIVRSGYRNQLNASAGSITALKDPTIQGTTTTYFKKTTAPKTPQQ